MLNDLQYALRILRRSPLFALAAVVLLALGIGGNATIFSMINGILLKPLPGLDTERLVNMCRTRDGQGSETNHSLVDLQDYGRAKSFEALAAFDSRRFSLASGGVAEGGVTERIDGALVTPNYFETLGVKLTEGRGFREGDERVAVISSQLRTNRFAGTTNILGHSIVVNGQAFTIIGVAPARFFGPSIIGAQDLWLPIAMQPTVDRGYQLLNNRDSSWVQGIARLRPGSTVGQAQAELNTITAQLQSAYPASNKGKGIRVFSWNPIGNPVGGGDGDVMTFLAMFAAVAGLTLLVVCANVANLLLSRAEVRRKEIAIRRSVGASTGHLVRQMLVEGVVLSLAAAALSLMIVLWGGEVLAHMMPPDGDRPITVDFSPDGKVVLFTFATALFTTLAFALAPALAALKGKLLTDLKAADSSVPVGRGWLRHGLVIGQISLGVVLLVAAGLLGRSVSLLKTADPKLQANEILLAALDPGANGYPKARVGQLYERLEEKLRELPGVRSGALGLMVPFTGGGFSFGPIRGGAVPVPFQTDMNLVGPGYLATLGIPLVAGREFSEVDTAIAPKVVILNQTLAQKLFPDHDALGKQIQQNQDLYTIIGIARDSRYRDLTEPARTLAYFPWRQHNPMAMTVHARVPGDPLAIVPRLREMVRQMDPALPLYGIRSLEMQREESFSAQLMAARLISVFAGSSVLVAAIGLYAAMAFNVARRTREIGIRMALGASRQSVLRASLRGGLLLTGIGLVVGLGASAAMSRLLSFLLYGIQPIDPVTFAGAALLLTAVSLAACYLPARRAASVDPMVALRYD